MMKKLLIISALLMAAFQIQASSYFTMGVRDTVYLNPACLNAFCNIPVIAHFESRYDSWTTVLLTSTTILPLMPDYWAYNK